MISLQFMKIKSLARLLLLATFLVLLDIESAAALDIDAVFISRASAGCAPLTYTDVIYRACSADACGRVVTGTTVRKTDTGWGNDQCGFVTVYHGVPYCKASYGDDGFISATATGSDGRIVDFLKHQCNISYDCTYSTFGKGTCRSISCGVEVPSKPATYSVCPQFSNGIDKDAFARLWNLSNDNDRAVLSIILLMDEFRLTVNSEASELFISWIRRNKPDDVLVQNKLNKIRFSLEKGTLTEATLTNIINGG